MRIWKWHQKKLQIDVLKTFRRIQGTENRNETIFCIPFYCIIRSYLPIHQSEVLGLAYRVIFALRNRRVGTHEFSRKSFTWWCIMYYIDHIMHHVLRDQGNNDDMYIRAWAWSWRCSKYDYISLLVSYFFISIICFFFHRYTFSQLMERSPCISEDCKLSHNMILWS